MFACLLSFNGIPTGKARIIHLQYPALRLPGVNDDDIEMQHAQKEPEEDHGDEHGLADEEVRDGLADEEVTSG